MAAAARAIEIFGAAPGIGLTPAIFLPSENLLPFWINSL
jgi:hypothetical protein